MIVEELIAALEKLDPKAVVYKSWMTADLESRYEEVEDVKGFETLRKETGLYHKTAIL